MKSKKKKKIASRKALEALSDTAQAGPDKKDIFYQQELMRLSRSILTIKRQMDNLEAKFGKKEIWTGHRAKLGSSGRVGVPGPNDALNMLQADRRSINILLRAAAEDGITFKPWLNELVENALEAAGETGKAKQPDMKKARLKKQGKESDEESSIPSPAPGDDEPEHDEDESREKAKSLPEISKRLHKIYIQSLLS